MNRRDLKDIIDYAIESEIESYEFYRDAALKVKNQILKELFQELAEEELDHKKFLEKFIADGLEEIELDEFNDYKISDTIEDEQKLSIDMDFSEAVALAIKREEEAMDRYAKLAAACLEEDKKKVFLDLKKMEQMHKAKLEDVYLNVAYSEVW